VTDQPFTEEEPGEPSEQRVTPLELFFDLVFVFAITQVTGYLAHDPTPGTLLRGILLLGALWWAWGAYAWLTNYLNPEEGAVRIAVFGSMAAMLIVALATPTAFGANALIFAVAYFIVRSLQLVLFAIAARGDRDLLRAIGRFVPGAVIGPSLLVVAAFFGGTAELLLWFAALTIDYLGAVAAAGPGWRISPEHFVERHGLIIIIALGESIIAIGVGAAGLPLDAGLITAAMLGIVVSAALWWSYFDWVVYVSQARLADATGPERTVLARDLYTYLHMPMVSGIVLFAFGMEATLAHAYEPLETVPAIGMCGGLALYFAAHVAMRLRIGGGWGHGRPVATVALLGLLPVATVVPALATLALVTGVCAGLIAYEAIRYRYARSWIRGHRGAFTMEDVRRYSGPGGGPPPVD
jgi:low temperature requirement protein LtrA